MIRIDSTICEVCGVCAGVCPADAIIVEGDSVHIEEERCTACLACVNVCPVGAPEEK